MPAGVTISTPARSVILVSISTVATEDDTFAVLKRRPASEVWPELSRFMREVMAMRNITEISVHDPEITTWLEKEYWDFGELYETYNNYINSLGFRFD